MKLTWIWWRTTFSFKTKNVDSMKEIPVSFCYKMVAIKTNTLIYAIHGRHYAKFHYQTSQRSVFQCYVVYVVDFTVMYLR